MLLNGVLVSVAAIGLVPRATESAPVDWVPVENQAVAVLSTAARIGPPFD